MFYFLNQSSRKQQFLYSVGLTVFTFICNLSRSALASVRILGQFFCIDDILHHLVPGQNIVSDILHLPWRLMTHLALHLEQHLALGVDLFLDRVVDVQQHVFTFLAVLRQSVDELDFPLVSEVLPLLVSLLQLFVPGLLSSHHLLLQLLQSGKGGTKMEITE